VELEQHIAAARGLSRQEVVRGGIRRRRRSRLRPGADVVERQGLVGVGLGLLPAPARLRLPLASHVRFWERTSRGGREAREGRGVGDPSRVSAAAPPENLNGRIWDTSSKDFPLPENDFPPAGPPRTEIGSRSNSGWILTGCSGRGRLPIRGPETRMGLF
jgi:hypothetical protein